MDFKKDLEKNEKTSENEALSDDALDAVSGGDATKVGVDVKYKSVNRENCNFTKDSNNKTITAGDIDAGGSAVNLSV